MSLLKEIFIFMRGAGNKKVLPSHNLLIALHGLLPPVVNLPNNVAGNRHSFSHKCQDDDPFKEDEEKSALQRDCYAWNPTTAMHSPAKNEVIV